MEYKSRGYNKASSSPSSYPCFSDQSVKEGLSVGGGQGQGGVVTREAVQQELEKEKLREEILAEEIAGRCFLEADARREFAIEREMMRMQISGQPFAAVDGRIAAPYGGGGGDGREVGGFEVDPYKLLPSKDKVIDLGNPDGATTLRAKPNSKPPPSAASILKKKTVEWSCAVCKLSTTCERNLNQHLAGKKHETNVNTMRDCDYKSSANGKPDTRKSPKTQPLLDKTSDEPCSTKKNEKWRCAVCKISAPCASGLADHLVGKKHQAKLVAKKVSRIMRLLNVS